MTDNSNIFEKLGRIQGDVSALLRGQDEMNSRIDLAFEDGRKLAAEVKNLAALADRGRWSLRMALWLGGSFVAGLTALAQLKTTLAWLMPGAG